MVPSYLKFDTLSNSAFRSLLLLQYLLFSSHQYSYISSCPDLFLKPSFMLLKLFFHTSTLCCFYCIIPICNNLYCLLNNSSIKIVCSYRPFDDGLGLIKQLAILLSYSSVSNSFTVHVFKYLFNVMQTWSSSAPLFKFKSIYNYLHEPPIPKTLKNRNYTIECILSYLLLHTKLFFLCVNVEYNKQQKNYPNIRLM